MPADLHELLRPALMNNTFDYKCMEDSLLKAYYNSYTYLYKRQVAEVNYNEFFYYTNDIDSRKRHESGRFYLNKSLQPVFEIDYDIIGNINREEYRRSRFYQNEFTYMDMIYNPQIFSQLPIVIIDNRVIYDYHISVSEDYTRFRLPFKRDFVLKNPRNSINDHVIYQNHRVQVITIDNTFYSRFFYNTGTLSYDTNRKTITLSKPRLEDEIKANVTNDTNKYYLSKYKVNNISELSEVQKGLLDTETKRRLKNLEIPNPSNGTFFLSFHFLNDKNKEYELGTSLLELEDDGKGTYTCKLPDNISTKIKNHPYGIYVSINFFRGLHKHIFYSNSNINRSENNMLKLMVIEDDNHKPYKSPIPIENMMIFKKTSDRDEFYLEKNTESIKVINTNIYDIHQEEDLLNDSNIHNGIKNGVEYKVYYFYYDIPNLQYRYKFRSFADFFRIIYSDKSFEEICTLFHYHKMNPINDRLPNSNLDLSEIYDRGIRDTQPKDTSDYNDIKYHEKIELIGKSEYPPFQFKSETLKKWIKSDQWILKDYVIDQKKLGASYYLFTNTLNLSDRLRRDTSKELGSGNLFRFEEDRYVFAFNNSREYPTNLDARIFVDGLLVGDVYQERQNFLEYFYIPSSMVSNDSFIELELFPRYKYKNNFKFTNTTDHKDIELPNTEEKIYPTAKDIIISENTSNGELRHDLDRFDVICHYEIGGDYKYEPIRDSDINNPVDLNNIPYRFTRLKSFTINANDNTVLNKNLSINISKLPLMIRFIADVAGYGFIEITSTEFQLNTEYFRIFRNGRLISRNRYRLITGYGYPKILIQQWLEQGDIVYIDITPYRYFKLYSTENIIRQDSVRQDEDYTNIVLNLKDLPLSKPFDIRYYDVYLNGRKLSINNVFNIDDYTITLVNIKSKYDLEIYERERDFEYFGSNYRGLFDGFGIVEKYYYDGTINREEMKKYLHDSVEEQKDHRLNIYPNTFDEDRFDQGSIDLFYAIYFLFYYDDLIPKHFYNPDVKQISSKLMIENFIEVYNKFRTSPVIIQSNNDEIARRENYPEVLYLDPDDWVDSSLGTPQRNQDNGQVLTWIIGHPDEIVDKDYKPIIPSDSNLV